MTLISKISISQLEHHMHDGGGVHRLTTSHCRFKTHLVSGCDCILIEAVAQTADNSIDVQCSSREKLYFEQYLAFEFQVTSFIGVSRIRLERDLHGTRGGGPIPPAPYGGGPRA